MTRFRDRADAGRRLSANVVRLGLTDPIVLALPRGGVPVAFEVAVALGAPLEVFVARKVGAPAQPEYGIGAVAEGGGVVCDGDALRAVGISTDAFEALAERERAEIERRVAQYRGARPAPTVEGRDVVVVDDGLATGVTAEAALVALRRRDPRRLVLAVPVCAADSAERLRSIADDVVCASSPKGFWAVGSWYDDFAQTTDAEVVALLEASSSP